MDRFVPLSRRRLLAGAGGLALGLGGAVPRTADDATPLRLGVLTDMSSLYADITGPGSLAAAKMAVEDFLASPHKMKRPIEVAQRRSHEQGRSRRQHRARMDRPRQCGCDHRRAELRGRARRPQCRAAEQQDDPGFGRIVLRSDRQGLFAQSRALELRYLCAVVWHCARRRRRGRQDLVHADRRLRFRPCDGSRR